MNFQQILPTEPLREYVRYFWMLEGSASAFKPFAMRTFASGFPQLIFHCQGIFEKVSTNQLCRKTSFLSGVHGQTNTYLDFQISENFGVFGIEFFPYALQTFFGISAGEFLNQFPDLHSVLNSNDIHLHERMLNAKNNKERVAIISRFLESRIGDLTNPEIIFAVKKIIQKQGILNIKNLADECCYSQRHFERKFKHLTGFTAKSFSSIIRFNTLLNNANYRNQTLTEIALDFGYYDQSHFINEFKKFSGYSPKTYFFNDTVKFSHTAL